MGTDLTTAQTAAQPPAAPDKRKLVAKMAEAYGLEPNAFLATMKTTIFPLAETNEQLITLLVVADQYGLNPFLRGELYAFPQAGGVVPVVGVDGWHRIANRQPDLDGWTIEWGDQMVKPAGASATCPEWAQITIYRKDRKYPVVVREWLDEVYRGTAPWKSHPKRMLRHKVIIQGFREAFGISGIYDEDEADRIVTGEAPMPSDRTLVAQPTNAERVLAAAGDVVRNQQGNDVIVSAGDKIVDADGFEYTVPETVAEKIDSIFSEEEVPAPTITQEPPTLAQRSAALDAQKAALIDASTGEVAPGVTIHTHDGTSEVWAEDAEGQRIELTDDQKMALGLMPTPSDEAVFDAISGAVLDVTVDAVQAAADAMGGDAVDLPEGEYDDEVPAEVLAAEAEAAGLPTVEAVPVSPPTDEQRKKMHALAGEIGLSDANRRRVIQLRYKVDSSRQLSAAQMSDLIDFLERQKALGF